MPKTKILSGLAVVKILSRFGFGVTSQKGSHIKLCREISGTRQILVVPNHKELEKGTLHAIIKQASSFVPTEKLQKEFYLN